jgi:hypothetical protein
LHTNKATASSFRQAAQGSMQYGALARSSLLVARHPQHVDRRVAVVAQANYGPQPALTFKLGPAPFWHGSGYFDVWAVLDTVEASFTVEELLGGNRRESVTDQNRAAVLDAVTSEPRFGRARRA